LNFAEALAAAIVKKDAIFIAGPDGVILEEPRSLDVNKKAAWLTAADDEGMC
jgi:hypothetical protein